MKQINKERNFISAVIYLCEKSDTIENFLNTLYDILSTNFLMYEIICVNDNAKQDILKEIRAWEKSKNITLTIIDMGFPQGLETSMTAGMDLTIGDYVLEFDSTFIDYDTSLIMTIYKKAMEGYDIVSARPLESYTRFTSKCFYKLFNRYSNLANTLATEKFHIISRRAINCIQSYTNINLYRKAVYLASGMSTSYVAYIPDKKQAVVYLNNGFRMNTASDALVLFTNFAYKISIYLSIIMAFVMLGFGLYTTIVYFG